MVKKFITKTEFAYNEIRERIGSGIIKKNQLYTVVDMANEIGISRTPVSGAIKILESEGYITLYPGVGFRIKDLTLSEIKESLLISGALEVVAMEYIMENATITDIKKQVIDSYVLGSKKAIEARDGLRYVEFADKYHKELYSMVDLKSVVDILDDHTFLHKSLYIDGVKKYPEEAINLVNDHNMILETILKRDKKKLREVIEKHEIHCYTILKKVLESQV